MGKDSKYSELHRAVGIIDSQACCIAPNNIVSFLLDGGADINARDGNGFTVLHIAVSRYDEEMVGYLLKRGVDVEVEDLRGRTALSLAKEMAPYPNGDFKEDIIKLLS